MENYIKKARIRKGLSQIEVARRAGCCQQMVSKAEGGRSISVASAKKIAPVLDINWTDFFREDESQGGGKEDKP